MNLLCIRQNGFTRAHGPPREDSRFSSWQRQLLAAPALALYRRERRVPLAPKTLSKIHKTLRQKPRRVFEDRPVAGPAVRSCDRDTVVPPCQYARAPVVKERRASPGTS